jgi:hypothetical protein
MGMSRFSHIHLDAIWLEQVVATSSSSLEKYQNRTSNPFGYGTISICAIATIVSTNRNNLELIYELKMAGSQC